MSDNAYDRHSYAGAAPDTTLSSSISDTDLTVTCADLTGWPDGTGGNFVVIFEPGKTAEEKCLASARSGNVLTLVSRGMEGAAAAHTATTTTVRHGFSARDANEANYAVHQTVGQISAKGSIVVGSAANTLVELPIGSTGQTLVVSGGTLAYGKPALAESDITGLVTDLAGKLATPATAIAKGSILAGTSANVADSVAVGADGTVLTADSTATGGVSWKTPQGLLTVVSYNPTSQVVKAFPATSTTGAPTTIIDSTNLKATFTPPTSGNVLVRVTCTVEGGGALLGLSATSTVSTWLGSPQGWLNGGSSAIGGSFAFYLTGLSGSQTIYLAGGAYGSSGTGGGIIYGGTAAPSIAGPVVIEVWAA